MTVVVTDAMARQWQPGAAMLRATAKGRSQFIRVPPPEVREVPVSLDDAMN